ncbi:hypothetical protein D3C76_824430 [compost metagenome]
MGIDVDRAGTQARDQPVDLAQVVGVDRRRQAVLRIVGQRQRLFLGVERHGYQHRPEDFLTDDAHVVVAVGKDGRLHEEASALDRLTAVVHLRPFGLAQGDVFQHPLLLLARHHGADEAVRVQPRGDLQRRRVARQRFEEGRVDTALDISTGTGIAHLPRVEEHTVGDRLGRSKDIGIGEHDHRRLAAQFQGQALHLVHRRLAHRAAHRGRTGKAQLVDARVAGHRRAHHAAAPGDNVQHTVGDARRLHQLGKAQGRQ